MLYYFLICLTLVPTLVVSDVCSFQGHLEKSKCICRSGWEGDNCESILIKKVFFSYSLLENSIIQNDYSEYNESQFFDWKEIYLQRRIHKLYNLNPNVNSSLQIDELFPDNDSSINISNVESLSWICKKKAIRSN